MEKENLWKILQGKSTMPYAIKYFGASEKEISEIMTEIKEADKHDATNYFIMGQQLARMAYDKLVELNEIDSTKIFNLATHSSEGQSYLGDMGFCGDKTYRYTNEGWQFLF